MQTSHEVPPPSPPSNNEDVEMKDDYPDDLEHASGDKTLEGGEVDADGESDDEGNSVTSESGVYPLENAEGGKDDNDSLFSGDDAHGEDFCLEKLIPMPEEESKDDIAGVNKPSQSVPAKPNKGKSKHHGDSWKKLTSIQRDRILTGADADWDNFQKFRTPFSERTRCWARREQKVLPGVANHSRALAAHCFILGTGRTVCHYHTTSDHGSDINDEAVAEDPDAKYKVTGVPYAPEKAEKTDKKTEDTNKKTEDTDIKTEDTDIKTPLYEKEFSHIERPATAKKKKGRGRSRVDPLDPNPNFTLKNVMDFFPKNAAGERYLHCGCLLEEVLVDFHYWKLIHLTSPSTGITEGVGRPFRPRDRQILCYILAQFSFFPFDLYDYNEDWEPVTLLDHRQQLIKRMARGVKKELRKKEEEQRRKDEQVRMKLEEEARKRAERDNLLLLQFGRGAGVTSDDDNEYSDSD